MTYPVIHLIELSRSTWIRDLVVFVILIHQILLNTSRFKQANSLPIRESIRQSWNPSIRIDLQEPWLLLSVLRDIDFGNLIWQAKLLKSYGSIEGLGVSRNTESRESVCLRIRTSQQETGLREYPYILMPLGVCVVYR